MSFYRTVPLNIVGFLTNKLRTMSDFRTIWSDLIAIIGRCLIFGCFLSDVCTMADYQTFGASDNQTLPNSNKKHPIIRCSVR